MSQAMAATWEHREDSELTLRGYRRAGGVANAVNRSAQAAYDSLTGRQQDMARLVFTQLTAITPDGQLARRRCSRADLRSGTQKRPQRRNTVIDIFSAQRLLVLGQDSVEIAHDALLQAWKQLRDWLSDDQLDRALYSQVLTDAGRRGMPTAGTPPTCTSRAGSPPSTPPPAGGRTPPPATRRYRPLARSSLAPRVTPRAAGAGGGEA